MTITTEPDFVYMFENGTPENAYIYDFNYNDRQYMLIFNAETSLYDKCLGIYNLTSQYGVYDFVKQNYADHVEWGVCVPCESWSPYDLDDPTTCLVCGSDERDDNFTLENTNA